MQCISPFYTRAPDTSTVTYIPAPCGKCMPCRLTKASDWYIRLKEEQKNNLFTLFITLTYNDENNSGNVDKREIQLFIKKLRKLYKFRYFLISEYGPDTFRPHYHMLLFTNEDIKFKDIEDKWTNGYVTVKHAINNRLKYVSRYHTDKGFNIDGLEKNFMLCSTKPAIGHCYLSKFRNYHEGHISRYYYTENGKKKPLPKYYKQKLYTKKERQTVQMSVETPDTLKEIEAYKKKYGNDQYFKAIDDNLRNKIQLFNNNLKK